MPAHVGQILFRAVLVGEREHNRDKRKQKGRERKRQGQPFVGIRDRRAEGRVQRVDRNFRGFVSLISATKFIYDTRKAREQLAPISIVDFLNTVIIFKT